MTKIKRNIKLEEKAQTNVIAGVVTLGVLGILIGVMVMIFSGIEPTLLDSSAVTLTDELTSPATFPAYLAMNNTMIENHNVNIYNSSTVLASTDFTVYWGNSTICMSDPGTSDVQASTAYIVTYTGQSTGYASVEGVNENVYKGFDLGSIAPLIMGASLVITIVMGMAGAFMMRKD